MDVPSSPAVHSSPALPGAPAGVPDTHTKELLEEKPVIAARLGPDPSQVHGKPESDDDDNNRDRN